MSLFLKFNLNLLLVFAVGLVPTGIVFGSRLEDNAREQTLAKAEIMMEMAMRGYTVSEVRPLIADQMAETFLPQSVPAYSATQIFEALRKQHPELSEGLCRIIRAMMAKDPDERYQAVSVVEEDLARLVTRAAKTAGSPEELGQALAQNIPDGAGREDFLRFVADLGE